ncbi:MAG: hypothetical protein ACK5HY_12635, partial [Parahaliea sp.]
AASEVQRQAGSLADYEGYKNGGVPLPRQMGGFLGGRRCESGSTLSTASLFEHQIIIVFFSGANPYFPA